MSGTNKPAALLLLGLLGYIAVAGCSSASKKSVGAGGGIGDAGAGGDVGTSAAGASGTAAMSGKAGGVGAGGDSGGESGAPSSGGESGADSAGSGGEAGAAAPIGGRGAIFLAAGFDHTCVALSDGAVRCWGDNEYSQLGQGPNTVDGRIGDDEPASAIGPVNVGKPAVQVACGWFNSCAVLNDGAMRCWGGSTLGYYPEQKIGDDETPASAGDVKVGGTVTALALGIQHACALLSTQAVRCWGTGISRQLGYANLGNTAEAGIQGDVPIGGKVLQISAGSNHTCVVLSNGAVRCWGAYNEHGELGYARAVNAGGAVETPASLGDVPVGGLVKQVAAGGAHTCALLQSGAVRCWGDGQYGQLGYGNTNNIGDDETPASAGDVDVGGTVVQLAAGLRHTCALLTGGKVRCWGWNSLGYPNSGSVGDDETPASKGDIDLGARATQIVAGGNHTCALVTGGAVRCWGDAYKGALGYGTPLIGNIGDNETPATAGDVPF